MALLPLSPRVTMVLDFGGIVFREDVFCASARRWTLSARATAVAAIEEAHSSCRAPRMRPPWADRCIAGGRLGPTGRTPATPIGALRSSCSLPLPRFKWCAGGPSARGTRAFGPISLRALLTAARFARCRCSRCCVRINARAGVADALAVHVRDWLDDLGGGSRAALGARLAQKIDVTCLCASLETLHEDLETDEERFHLRGNAQVLEAAVVRDQLQTEVDPNSENREFMGRHGRGPETLYRAQVVSLHSSPLYRCRSLAPRRLRCGIDFVV